MNLQFSFTILKFIKGIKERKVKYNYKKRLCDFFTCWTCQGKVPPNKEERAKLRKISSQKPKKRFNPHLPEKHCSNENCKYCLKIIKTINLQKPKYYSQLEIEENKSNVKEDKTNNEEPAIIKRRKHINKPPKEKIDLTIDTIEEIEEKI